MKQEKNKTCLPPSATVIIPGVSCARLISTLPSLKCHLRTRPCVTAAGQRPAAGGSIVPGLETTDIDLKPKQAWDSRQGAGASWPRLVPELHLEQALPFQPELRSAPAAPQAARRWVGTARPGGPGWVLRTGLSASQLR